MKSFPVHESKSMPCVWLFFRHYFRNVWAPLVGFIALVALVNALLGTVARHLARRALAAGVPVPTQYLAWALLYCALYSAAMMLLA